MALEMAEKSQEPRPQDLPGRLLVGSLARATVVRQLPGVPRWNQDGRIFLCYPDMSLQHLLHIRPSGKGALCFHGAGDGGKFEAEAVT